MPSPACSIPCSSPEHRGTRGGSLLRLIAGHATTCRWPASSASSGFSRSRGTLRLLLGERASGACQRRAERARRLHGHGAALAPTVRATGRPRVGRRHGSSAMACRPCVLVPRHERNGRRSHGGRHAGRRAARPETRPRISSKREDDAGRAAYRELLPRLRHLRDGRGCRCRWWRARDRKFLWNNRRLPDRSVAGQALASTHPVIRRIWQSG